jgi:signal transduction histidine kinase
LNALRSIDNDVAAVGRIVFVPEVLELAALTCGLRFSAIARVTETHWTACAVYDHLAFGLTPGGELALETTICNEIRRHRRSIAFSHASKDPIYAFHPTPQIYGLESLISTPIVLTDGSFFGTLCALDTAPSQFDRSHITRIFELFAVLLAKALSIEIKEGVPSETKKQDRRDSFLTEEIVAILGHDLRSPVQSIAMGAEMLARDLPDGRERRVSQHIQRSAMRMGELIHNIMDFAKARLGSGIVLSISHHEKLAQDLRQVVDEVRSIHPDRQIEMVVQAEAMPMCDKSRIAQLLNNLISNAVAHGDRKRPVRVVIASDDISFSMRVENDGPAIPSEMDQRSLLKSLKSCFNRSPAGNRPRRSQVSVLDFLFLNESRRLTAAI